MDLHNDFGAITNIPHVANVEFMNVRQNKIHIRIQQRNGKKCITTISGFEKDMNCKQICKHMRKLFCCNGNVDVHADHGAVIQLQGDHRLLVKDWLIENTIVTDKDHIVIHGG